MAATTTSLPSPRILGKESLQGGRFDQVTVLGKGTVDGDLEARRLVVQGKLDVRGSARVGTLDVAGKATFGGPVTAEELRLQGALEVQGDLTAGVVQCPGKATVRGQVKADDVTVRGAFDISGRLTAARVELELSGNSRCQALSGESIAVRLRPDAEQTVIRRGIGSVRITAIRGGQTRPARLEVESISADTVSLEATSAERVSGRKVRIGKGCEVGRVEYSEEYEVADGARVGSAVKTA